MLRRKKSRDPWPPNYLSRQVLVERAVAYGKKGYIGIVASKQSVYKGPHGERLREPTLGSRASVNPPGITAEEIRTEIFESKRQLGLAAPPTSNNFTITGSAFLLVFHLPIAIHARR